MKIYLDKLEDFHLYKNTQVILGNSSNKSKNYLILTNLMDNQEFDRTFKSNIFNGTIIRSYYHPKIYYSTVCKKRKINEVQKQKYEFMKEKYPSFINLKIKLENYNNLNTYYDMNEINKIFNEVYKEYTWMKKSSLYQDLLKEVIGRISYNNIMIHIVPEGLITNGRNFGRLESMLYYWMKEDIFDTEFFSNTTFIISDSSSKIMFKVKLKNLKEGFDVELFKRYCNIVYKYENNIALDNDEIETTNISDSEDKLKETTKQKEITKVELKNTIKKNNRLNSKSLSKSLDIIDKVVDDSEISNKNEIAKSLNNNEEFKDSVKEARNKTTNIASDVDYEYNQQEFKGSDDIYNYKNLEDEDEEEMTLDSEFSDFDEKKEMSNFDTKHLNKLKEKQSSVKVKVNGKEASLDEIKNNNETYDIDTEIIKIDTLNEEVRKSTLKDLDRSYVKLQQEKDLVKVITGFNDDSECPIYVTDVKRENTSTSFDKKETLTITYEDMNKKKHTVKIDIPLIIDNSFLYLNNGKKAISKQLNILPIVKSKPDEVIVSTNYSKVYISRFGKKTNPNTDKLKKFISKDLPTSEAKVTYMLGSNIGVNSKYESTLEYDDLSTFFISLTVDKFYIDFNRGTVEDTIESKLGIDVESLIKANEFGLAVDSKTKTFFTISLEDSKIKEYSTENKKVGEYNSIYDLYLYKIKNYKEEYYNILINEKIAKKYMYTRISVLNQKFPLIILLGFYFGLEKVLDRYNIKYEFLEKKKHQTDDEINNENLIQFEDGYFYYDSSIIKNNLLLAGLNEMDTKNLSFTSLNSKEGYYDVFEDIFGNRQIGKGLNNFLSLFLDPITKEVCADLKLPTDLLGIFLYANTMLESNKFVTINNMSNYRIRSMELINAQLYKILADAVKQYKDLYKNGRTEARISVRQDQLIKEILESQIVDSYSTLNPVLEVEKLGSTNYKGLSGTNKDTAFTPQMRAYDKTMVGLIGMSSPDSNKVGIVRQMSFDPCITSTRGYITTPENPNELEATNIFSPGELLSCYTSIHADPPQRGFNIEIYCRNLFNCWEISLR